MNGFTRARTKCNQPTCTTSCWRKRQLDDKSIAPPDIMQSKACTRFNKPLCMHLAILVHNQLRPWAENEKNSAIESFEIIESHLVKSNDSVNER